MFFFFNDTATTEIYTLSLHDALPISGRAGQRRRLHVGEQRAVGGQFGPFGPADQVVQDRKSTRLNSSHGYISYAVFCLKKKKNTIPAKTASITAQPSRTPVPVRDTIA